MTTHAKLSASGSPRWLGCPGSVQLEATAPDNDTSSVYAEEGTAAHALADKALKANRETESWYGQEDEETGLIYSLDMCRTVQDYVDFCNNLPGEHFTESKVDYSPWVPDGFGTSDFIAIDGNTAHIVDLKYGKGVRVDAEENTQAMLYGLGAVNTFGFLFDEIENFILTIYQPRLDHVSEWQISRDDLMAFGEYARERAAMTEAENPEFNPSEKACQWCKAKGKCKALADFTMSTISDEFAEVGDETFPDAYNPDSVNVLSVQDVANILPHVKLMQGWLNELEGYALSLLEDGVVVPGYKLVEGKTNRKWRDTDAALKALKRTKFKIDEVAPRKVITITQAEKLLGKKHKIFNEHVYKPEGKPAIAPDSDKRPALTPAGNDFDDFLQ